MQKKKKKKKSWENLSFLAAHCEVMSVKHTHLGQNALDDNGPPALCKQAQKKTILRTLNHLKQLF